MVPFNELYLNDPELQHDPEFTDPNIIAMWGYGSGELTGLLFTAVANDVLTTDGVFYCAYDELYREYYLNDLERGELVPFLERAMQRFLVKRIRNQEVDPEGLACYEKLYVDNLGESFYHIRITSLQPYGSRKRIELCKATGKAVEHMLKQIDPALIIKLFK